MIIIIIIVITKTEKEYEQQRQLMTVMIVIEVVTVVVAVVPTINVFDKYPTLVIDTLIANPIAFIQNKCFVNVDLNREFSTEKLVRTRNYNNNNNNNFSTIDDESQQKLPYETIRAYEIDSLLGPKVSLVRNVSSPSLLLYNNENTNPNVDVVIDLHTTTFNMGITLIIPEGGYTNVSSGSICIKQMSIRIWWY